MKVNFNYQLAGLDGKQIEGDENTAAKIVASALSASNKGNAIKLYDWALKLWNKQAIEIDDTDYQVLYNFIESTELLTIMCKAQILKNMSASREKTK